MCSYSIFLLELEVCGLETHGGWAAGTGDNKYTNAETAQCSGGGRMQADHCLERRSYSEDWGEADPVWDRTEKRDPVQLMCLVLGWAVGAVVPSWITS